ncbi:MAG: hypothetical protein ACT6SG_20590, partial [Hydrogenophaga sp.]|uniref:hypothetical protein n=1 Tax=Hydrogenophaga sp. TaxID=1904254 RepID=UPI004035F2BF
LKGKRPKTGLDGRPPKEAIEAAGLLFLFFSIIINYNQIIIIYNRKKRKQDSHAEGGCSEEPRPASKTERETPRLGAPDLSVFPFFFLL